MVEGGSIETSQRGLGDADAVREKGSNEKNCWLWFTRESSFEPSFLGEHPGSFCSNLVCLDFAATEQLLFSVLRCN
jgi:hypothetical protein